MIEVICCWCDVDCDEVGMKLELVETNQSLVVTSPFHSLIMIDVHFPIYMSLVLVKWIFELYVYFISN